LHVITDYNRGQFRLYTALGNPPLCALENACKIPLAEPSTPGPAVMGAPANPGTE
jgi:hypothetical protein